DRMRGGFAAHLGLGPGGVPHRLESSLDGLVPGTEDTALRFGVFAPLSWETGWWQRGSPGDGGGDGTGRRGCCGGRRAACRRPRRWSPRQARVAVAPVPGGPGGAVRCGGGRRRGIRVGRGGAGCAGGGVGRRRVRRRVGRLRGGRGRRLGASGGGCAGG